jgi:hypothetical protein
VAGCKQATQVRVALFVLSQKRNGRAVIDCDLCADDEFDSTVFGGDVCLNDAVESIPICYGDGGKAQSGRGLYEFGGAAGPFEKGKVAFAP